MTNTLFDTIPFLDHPPILLRHIQESDLDNLWEIYSNPLHFQYTPNTSTKSKETLRKRISHFQRDFNKKKRLFLGLEFQGKLIGVLEVRLQKTNCVGDHWLPSSSCFLESRSG